MTKPDPYDCLEDNPWTAIPSSPAPPFKPVPDPGDSLTLSLKDAAPDDFEKIQKRGKLTFHMMGCSGDPAPGHQGPQDAVARAMAAQLADAAGNANMPGAAVAASFLYHLGDMAYKEKKNKSEHVTRMDIPELYKEEFYAPYAGYRSGADVKSIFAIAGNHDGKDNADPDKSPIYHFMMNFCADGATVSPDNQTGDGRTTATQPYPYWVLDTPVASIIGLYTNVANGGILDDPNAVPDYRKGPQYQWLVDRLAELRKQEKAVLLALHYPPYSGMTNFQARGNPKWSKADGQPSPVTQYPHAVPIGQVLQQAFSDAGCRPDAVFSAHAHLYQRITYTYLDGYEIPYLIAGSGGHAMSPDKVEPDAPGYYLMPEQLTESCDGGPGNDQLSLPYHLVMPDGLQIASGDQAVLANINDRDFGFLRVTVDWNASPPLLVGEFFAVPVPSVSEPPYKTYPRWPQSPDRMPQEPFVYDRFTVALDPARHKVSSTF